MSTFHVNSKSVTPYDPPKMRFFNVNPTIVENNQRSNPKYNFIYFDGGHFVSFDFDYLFFVHFQFPFFLQYFSSLFNDV